MGLYATTTSLQTLMVGTTFDTVTSSLAAKLITHAENEINKYLSKRYDIATFNTTSTAVPPLVTSLAETLSEGYMHQRMSRGGKDAMKRGQDLIDGVLKNLDKIATYQLDLVSTAGAVLADMSQTAYRILSSTDSYADTFNEGNPLDWAVSESKLDDIESEDHE